MNPETVAYYCFYSKAQNEKNLTNEYMNIYYNKNQPKAKTNLKLSSRTFFGHTSQSMRDRTYSDNASSALPSLETGFKNQLKNSESTDKLQNALEEEKMTIPQKQQAELSSSATDQASADLSAKKAEAKKMLEKAAEPVFKEVPVPKKGHMKKAKKNKRRNKKNKYFHNGYQ